MPEIPSEVLKNQIDYLGLHLWRELLVEAKFFNDQIVIVLKGLLNCL